MTERYNATITRLYNKNAKVRPFSVGDLVLYKTHFLSNASKGFSVKLAPRWEGPYCIQEKVSESVFTIQHVESSQIVNKVHTNDLTPFNSSSNLDPGNHKVNPSITKIDKISE